MYESLTKFLSRTDDIKYEFADAVNDFVLAHPDFDLRNYKAILSEHNITSPKVDVSSFDGKLVMTVIVAIVRTDRFHEGLLKRCIEDGRIEKCLLRLKELDGGD